MMISDELHVASCNNLVSAQHIYNTMSGTTRITNSMTFTITVGGKKRVVNREGLMTYVRSPKAAIRQADGALSAREAGSNDFDFGTRGDDTRNRGSRRLGGSRRLRRLRGRERRGDDREGGDDRSEGASVHAA